MQRTLSQFSWIFVLSIAVAFSGCDQIQSMIKPEQMKKTFSAGSSEMAKTDSVKSPEIKKEDVEQKELPPNILAKVGEWTITNDDFNKRLEEIAQTIPDFDLNDPNTRGLVLEEIVRQQLFFHEAEKTGAALKNPEVKQALEEFKRNIFVQFMVSQATDEVVATEEEAKEYYDANEEQFVTPVEYKVREVVVFTQAKAKELLVELLQGADFAQKAKELSKGKTASNGGDLGYITVAPFAQMQNTLEVLGAGDVSSVFKGPEGYYIVKLEGKRGGALQPFEELKDDLVSGLTVQKQQNAILEALNAIAEKVNIQINEKLLAPQENKE